MKGILEAFNNQPKEIYRKSPFNIETLNAAKLICAFMVVGIHIDFFISSYIGFIYRIAVPFFFFISGYFLVNNNGCISTNKLKKIFVKVLFIIIITNSIYYIYLSVISRRIIHLDILRILLIGDNLCYVLWYLTAFAEAILLIWLLVEFKLTKLIPILAIIGLLCNILFGSYNFILQNSESLSFLSISSESRVLSRNFFTIGLPCIAAGMWIRIKERFIKAWLLVLSSFVLLILLALEHHLINLHTGEQPRGDIILLTVPFACSLFLICLNIKKNYNTIHWLSKLGKYHSQNIYIFHILFNSIIGLVLFTIPFEIKHESIWRMPLIILITLMFSYFLLNMKSLLNRIGIK